MTGVQEVVGLVLWYDRYSGGRGLVLWYDQCSGGNKQTKPLRTSWQPWLVWLEISNCVYPSRFEPHSDYTLESHVLLADGKLTTEIFLKSLH